METLAGALSLSIRSPNTSGAGGVLLGFLLLLLAWREASEMMGISDGGGAVGGEPVDCSPGTIVWVRRRNGSWWPGRILGPEELAASHLLSPRSGTPVKLLGRDDASVDWYNIEKSKRVKSFRCGEFDACIERAEASQGVTIRKREKYARREDAILHALELERKQLELKSGNQRVTANGIISVQEEKYPLSGAHQAKRSRCIYMPADSNDPLAPDVFSSDWKPAVGLQFEENYLEYFNSVLEQHVFSGLIEKNRSESSGRGYSAMNTDEETELLEDVSQSLAPESEACDPSGFQASENFRNMANEVSGYVPQLAHREMEVSKWHVKGKRNSRNVAKRRIVMDHNIRSEPNGSTVWSTYQSKEQKEVKSTRHRFLSTESVQSRYDSQRCPATFEGLKHSQRSHTCFNNSGNISLKKSSHHFDREPYLEETGQFHLDFADQPCSEVRSMLVDVNLAVQAKYQGEHVPLVSLMSRLNGKAIVGHPVHIEILEDGSADRLYLNNDFGLDQNMGDDEGAFLDSDWRAGPKLKKHSSHVDHRVRLLKQSMPHAWQKKGKFHKKPLKRTALSSQKTRTLSSIATDKNFSSNRGTDVLGGLIKPAGSIVPPVTCVPVKVVFSRILEALGRSSLAVAHRVKTASPATLDPSYIIGIYSATSMPNRNFY